MIKLIAIVEKNFGLSKNGEIPWEFAEDRKLFQRLTKNSVVIMGKNTFFSHKNFPLKDRDNCVITKENISNAINFPTLEEAIEHYPDAWIIGGAQLYNYALRHNLIDEAIITLVSQEYEADTFLDVHYFKHFDRQLIIQKGNYSVWKLKKRFGLMKNYDINDCLSKSRKKLNTDPVQAVVDARGSSHPYRSDS